MGDIINLRQARKAKARRDKEVAAAANRVKFGRSKTEREVQRHEAARLDRQLDGNRREDDADSSKKE